LPGGTVPFVRAFPDRIHSAQLSDNRGRVDEHMAIGKGTIDFRRVLGALRRIDFAGPLIIELFDVPKKLASHRRLLVLLREAPGAGRAGKGRGRHAARRVRGARGSRGRPVKPGPTL
jgi:sugar phosphate isomerase/epimerase